MYRLLIAIAILSVSSGVFAKDTYVRSTTRQDGTPVQDHYRTAPDSTRSNNYSTLGNVNPYTGRPGTVSPYGGTTSTQPSPPVYTPYGAQPTRSGSSR